MADPHSLRAEIDALRAQLAGQAQGGDAPAGPSTDPWPSRAEIERLLREVESGLAEAARDAEALAVAHPATALAASFLLGLAVGRLLGRWR